MKRIVIAIAIAIIANTAFAGLTYKVESASTGIHEGTTTGVAEVEGKSFRFNVSVGDGAILNDSSFIVSQNGRTVAVVDPSSNTMIKCLDATVLVQTGTHGTFFGNATVNGVATTYRIDVNDLAEPGAGKDTFSIQTGNGYTAGGVLTAGNIQVHN